MECLVLILILFAGQTLGQDRDPCMTVYLYGADDVAFPTDRGFYTLLNTVKHGRPIYMSNVDNNPLYLYYDMYENTEDGYWFVSSKVNSILTGTRAPDNATHPEDITNSWQELYRNSEGNLDWKESTTIRAICVDNGCESGRLLVGSVSENQHPLQLDIQGTYSIQEGLHNRRPVYIHDTHDWRIYYNENLNEDNSTFSYWAVSKEVGSDQVSALSTIPAPDPAFIDSGWRIYSNTEEQFTSQPEFRSKCIAADFELCSSRSFELTLDGIHELALQYIKDTIGTYEVQEGHIINVRPVYKQKGGKYYLFYTWKEDIGVGYWTVGKIPRSDVGVILFVIDHALRPELINNKVWNYFFPLTVTGNSEYKETEGIQLICKRLHLGAVCDDYLCENGGSCVMESPNVTYCRCVEGYYGARCEIAKHCETPPSKISHGVLWTTHNETSYLSLALYLCDANYFSKHSDYFAVCGEDGSWGSTPICLETPTSIALDEVHVSAYGTDHTLCGNATAHCQTLRYGLQRVAEGGTVYIHGVISECGTQTVSSKEVNIVGWRDTDSGPTPGFNCTLGHSFLSFSNSKVTLDDLHIHGAIIYILDSNEVTLTNIHLLNTAVQNYVVNSDQLTLRFENVVWESDIPCEVDSSFMQFDLEGGLCVTSWSSLNLFPALTSSLRCKIINSTFINTMVNIGGRKRTQLSIDKSFFTSNDTKSKQFLNIIVTNGKSSVNITNSMFKNMLFEDIGGKQSYKYAGLIIQEGEKRKDESFLEVKLDKNLFENNSRGIMIEVTDKAKVAITNSSFLSNVGYGGGGAIWATQGKLNRVADTLELGGIFVDLLGLTDKGIKLDLIGNVFEDNYAVNYGPHMEYTGRGGAVFMDSKLEGLIFDSVFRNNTAQLLGGSVFAGQDSSLVVGGATEFRTSPEGRNSFLGEALYAEGFLFIGNVTIIGEMTSDNVPLLSYIRSGRGVSSFAHIQELNVTCPRGHKVLMRNSSSEYRPQLFDQIHFSCVSCPDGTYSPYGASYWIHVETKNDASFGYDPKLIVNYTSGTQIKNVSDKDIVCLPCPYGGECTSAGLMARRNYWGYVNMDEITFEECQPGYGCQEEVCSDYNACAPNRMGTLCSDCIPGYSQTFWGTECVPNYKCTASWIWGVMAIYGVIYVLILLMEYEWKAFMHTQKHWFKSKILQCCSCFSCCTGKESAGALPPAGQGNEEEEHNERGLVRIFLYYLQIGLLLQLDILYKDDDQISSKTKSFEMTFNQIFNFNVAPMHKSVCVMPGWNAISKLISQGVFVGYIFLIATALYPIWFFFSKICKSSSFSKKYLTESQNKPRPEINVRFIVLFIELLLFTYQAVAEVTLTSLDCIPVAGRQVLSVRGSMECYQPWQYGLVAVLVVYVLPLFLVMLLGPGSLVADTLPWPLFLLSCVFPFLFLIIYPVVYLRARSRKHKRKPTTNNQTFGEAIADKISGPFQYRAGLCWEGVTTLQRLLLALLVTLVNDILVKHFLLALCCLLFLLLHVVFRPYKVHSSNSVDVVSLLLLCLLSLISLVKSVLYKVGIVPYGELQSVFFALEYVEFVLLVVIPALILLLVIVLCIMCVCSWLLSYCKRCCCTDKNGARSSYSPEKKKQDEDESSGLQDFTSSGAEEDEEDAVDKKAGDNESDYETGQENNTLEVKRPMTNGTVVTATAV